MSRIKDAIDERFGPILDAIDDAKEPFNLLAGENIYMLALLLYGSIEDAPSDIRELFRGAVVQLLCERKDRDNALRLLCLEGRIG